MAKLLIMGVNLLRFWPNPSFCDNFCPYHSTHDPLDKIRHNPALEINNWIEVLGQ